MSPTASVYALISHEPRAQGRVLRAAFAHPWVASYQIGFGPPLLRATPRLTELGKAADSALAKLDVYLDFLLAEERERRRMSDRLRIIALNRHQRLDAELIDRANNEALDLSLRLHAPAAAPPAVKRAMLEAGISSAPDPMDQAPEALTARICLRLADFDDSGLIEWVGADPAAWALEFWLPPPAEALFEAFFSDVGARTSSCRW